MIYAKTYSDFQERDKELEDDELSKKYPHFVEHLAKAYGRRIETWALFYRRENNLPTRGSETNNYVETSMKLTKEKQFSRVRTHNHVELLKVLCDDSALYITKLVDIGNGRDSALRQANSKYLERENKYTKEQIVELGESRYLVQSEKSDEVWYMCDMKSGYCSCPVGTNCSPCKHKFAVSKHFKEANFTVAPSHDARQRALYHYVALGKTLSPHMYRISGDDCSIEDIERFINDQFSMFEDREEHDQMLHVVEEPFVQQNDPFDSNGGDEEEIYDAELVRRKFSEAFDAYKDEILRQHAENPQDPAMNKAMMAITRSMKRSLKCKPLTMQSQMHNFAAGTVGKSKTKRGGVINVNPPSLARRTFKVPGRGPAPLGRPLRDRAGQTQMFITDNEDIIARSDGNFIQQTKKTHKFAKILETNTSAPKRHTKQ